MVAIKGIKVDELLKPAGSVSAQIIEYLLENGAKVNQVAMSKSGTYLSTALKEAVKTSNLELIRFLLDKGADLNLAHPIGDTVRAVGFNKEIFEFLLNRGAEINYKDDQIYTILQQDRPRFEIISDTDDQFYTPLELAVKYQIPEGFYIIKRWKDNKRLFH